MYTQNNLEVLKLVIDQKMQDSCTQLMKMQGGFKACY